MKCLACDCILTDDEAVRKYDGTNIFIDLCNSCLSQSPLAEDYECAEFIDVELDEED